MSYRILAYSLRPMASNAGRVAQTFFIRFPLFLFFVKRRGEEREKAASDEPLHIGLLWLRTRARAARRGASHAQVAMERRARGRACSYRRMTRRETYDLSIKSYVAVVVRYRAARRAGPVGRDTQPASRWPFFQPTLGCDAGTLVATPAPRTRHASREETRNAGTTLSSGRRRRLSRTMGYGSQMLNMSASNLSFITSFGQPMCGNRRQERHLTSRSFGCRVHIAFSQRADTAEERGPVHRHDFLCSATTRMSVFTRLDQLQWPLGHPHIALTVPHRPVRVQVAVPPEERSDISSEHAEPEPVHSQYATAPEEMGYIPSEMGTGSSVLVSKDVDKSSCGTTYDLSIESPSDLDRVCGEGPSLLATPLLLPVTLLHSDAVTTHQLNLRRLQSRLRSHVATLSSPAPFTVERACPKKLEANGPGTATHRNLVYVIAVIDLLCCLPSTTAYSGVLQQGLANRARNLRELTEAKALSTDSPASRDVDAQLQPELELLHAALSPRRLHSRPVRRRRSASAGTRAPPCSPLAPPPPLSARATSMLSFSRNSSSSMQPSRPAASTLGRWCSRHDDGLLLQAGRAAARRLG
ncbi:hypothetical protein B0H14DRAFT_3679461 [Mycena olivaceomarginata]|nr:hypothetical protein B0H14DRAFT_3679461 [Mycena olivaceomarginata]